jgi:hypothetical protein
LLEGADAGTGSATPTAHTPLQRCSGVPPGTGTRTHRESRDRPRARHKVRHKHRPKQGQAAEANHRPPGSGAIELGIAAKLMMGCQEPETCYWRAASGQWALCGPMWAGPLCGGHSISTCNGSSASPQIRDSSGRPSLLMLGLAGENAYLVPAVPEGAPVKLQAGIHQRKSRQALA